MDKKKKFTPKYWENVYTGLKSLFYIWVAIIVILGLMYSCGYHAGKEIGITNLY